MLNSSAFLYSIYVGANTVRPYDVTVQKFMENRQTLNGTSYFCQAEIALLPYII